MGLDMYLNKKTYTQRWSHQEKEKTFEVTVKRGGKKFSIIQPDRVSYVIERVGYWRKFNALHRWFVENVQKGEDDCGEYSVEREQLRELLKDLSKVIDNPKEAKNALPTASGFFFGGTEYDEFYFQKVKETAELIESLLKEAEADPEYLGEFFYTSSW